MDKKTKLSPTSKHKSKSSKNKIQQGFNRQDFKSKIEDTFDKTFRYEREVNERYQYIYAQKINDKKLINNIEKQYTLKDKSSKLEYDKQHRIKEFLKSSYREKAKIERQERIKEKTKNKGKNHGQGYGI